MPFAASDRKKRRQPVRWRGATFIRQPRGVSLLEVLFLLTLCCFLAMLVSPSLLRMRETSRRQTCQQRLRTLTLALRQYHDVHLALPPAAIWDHSVTESLALHRSRRIDLITQSNWALLLLPYLGTPLSSEESSPQGAIGERENARWRETPLAAMTCPDDPFNRVNNRYRFLPVGTETEIEFARGNYAINGGTHHFETDPPTTTSPHGDAVHLIMNATPRRYELWGNGIAGINHAFRLTDFVNGQGTLVALEEVRAGIHPLDPRGVWSLGQIGGSITWGHGVNGDAVGPNQSWARSDDIMNCEKLHRVPGTETLQRLNMPCVDYVDLNQQATARSQHPGGVHVSLLDGSVRFLADAIDPGLWHVLHSRETPPEILAGRLDQTERLPHDDLKTVPLPKAPSPSSESSPEELPEEFQNSIKQTFRRLRSGTFVMGLPDTENSDSLPAEIPPHKVTLTGDFWMGTREVTRSQFQQVMGAKHLPQQPDALPDDSNASRWGDFPVTNLSWNQARDFCEVLSARPEEQAASRSYRLPTEAEWEYACRSGARVPHRWRGVRLPDDHSGEAAGMIPPLPVQPVGSYPPNAWGLFDLRGNVWEWTADWYARDYYARSPSHDPPGPITGDLKVVRGSDWRFVGETCRLDAAVLPPWKGNPLVGFRIVCEAVRSQPAFRHPGN